MKNKPVHDVRHMSERRWFEQVMQNRTEAQKAGNLQAVARCDELLARRMNLIPESPARKKELNEIEKEEVRILARLRFDPRAKPIIEEIRDEIAGEQAGNGTKTTPENAGETATQAVQKDPITPHEADGPPYPSCERKISGFEERGSDIKK